MHYEPWAPERRLYYTAYTLSSQELVTGDIMHELALCSGSLKEANLELWNFLAIKNKDLVKNSSLLSSLSHTFLPSRLNWAQVNLSALRNISQEIYLRQIGKAIQTCIIHK